MQNKILVVMTTYASPTTSRKLMRHWLNTPASFYNIMDAHGYQVDYVQPHITKTPPSIPPNLVTSTDSNHRYPPDLQLVHRLKNPCLPHQINPTQYCAIYFLGGHQAFWEYTNDTLLQDITRQVYENGGVVAALSHGLCGLLNVRLSDGSFLLNNRNVTGFSKQEEQILGTYEKRFTKIPYVLQNELSKRHSIYQRALLPFTGYTVVDGRIITGQNPQSANRTAKVLVDVLAKRATHRRREINQLCASAV